MDTQNTYQAILNAANAICEIAKKISDICTPFISAGRIADEETSDRLDKLEQEMQCEISKGRALARDLFFALGDGEPVPAFLAPEERTLELAGFKAVYEVLLFFGQP